MIFSVYMYRFLVECNICLWMGVGVCLGVLIHTSVSIFLYLYLFARVSYLISPVLPDSLMYMMARLLRKV